MNQTITSLDPLPAETPARPPRPRSAPGRLTPLSKYDAARTNQDNARHWANADGLSANAANGPDVRRTLRNRSRYEDDNNAYANGLTGDRANETVGTGPRLQLTLPERVTDPDFQRDLPVPADAARAVEERWGEWCDAVGMLDDLLVMDEAETRDGEVFGLQFVNPALPHPVQLDVRLYEADQVATPFPDLKPGDVDGLEFDRHGNPAFYHVLRQHPGDAWWGGATLEFDRVPARQVIHLFKPRRPGQARGVPAFTSSLPLYSVLRRYTLASLLTAEAQARINAVIEQEHALPGCEDDGEGGEDDATGEQIQFAGTHMLTLSAGQKAKTLAASAPAPGYKEFKAEVLTESGRPVNAPGNVSRGTSADMNYSSGRLDQQQWQRAIRIRRRRLERIVLNVLFRAWLSFAVLVPGYLPAGLPPVAQWKWKWRWDGFVSIDPVKDGKAATERLANGTSSLDRECGELGEDWEEVQDQRLREEQREARRREAMGLPPKTERVAAPVPPPGPDEEREDDG